MSLFPGAQTALAQRYNCSIESSQSALTDWVVLLRADTLVMASSTFCYFQVRRFWLTRASNQRSMHEWYHGLIFDKARTHSSYHSTHPPRNPSSVNLSKT